jgi:hypothetical protein
VDRGRWDRVVAQDPEEVSCGGRHAPATRSRRRTVSAGGTTRNGGFTPSAVVKPSASPYWAVRRRSGQAGAGCPAKIPGAPCRNSRCSPLTHALVRGLHDRLALGLEGPLLARGTAALAAGAEPVALDGGGLEVAASGQGLVALEAVVDRPQHRPQAVAVRQGANAAERIDAGGGGPTRPRSRAGKWIRSFPRPFKLVRSQANQAKALAKAAALGICGCRRASVNRGRESRNWKPLPT